jgi:hypothetical protein
MRQTFPSPRSAKASGIDAFRFIAVLRSCRYPARPERRRSRTLRRPHLQRGEVSKTCTQPMVHAVKINHAPMEGKRKKQCLLCQREWAIADRISGN